MKFMVLIFSFLASAFISAQPIELLPIMAPALSINWQYDTVILELMNHFNGGS